MPGVLLGEQIEGAAVVVGVLKAVTAPEARNKLHAIFLIGNYSKNIGKQSLRVDCLADRNSL